jgi:transcriptional regulator with XRE-family HTH domain
MNKLKEIREQKGLLQKELAELSSVKLVTVQKLDGGINNINKAQANTLYKLAKVLEVSIEDLIDTDEL